jgi:hypothetical protein
LDEEKKYTIATEHEQISSDSWMNKENTISNLYLQFDNSRPETPVNMFLQSPLQNHHTTNYKPKFDPIRINICILCPRSINDFVENLKIQINQYLDTQKQSDKKY